MQQDIHNGYLVIGLWVNFTLAYILFYMIHIFLQQHVSIYS